MQRSGPSRGRPPMPAGRCHASADDAHYNAKPACQRIAAGSIEPQAVVQAFWSTRMARRVGRTPSRPPTGWRLWNCGWRVWPTNICLSHAERRATAMSLLTWSHGWKQAVCRAGLRREMSRQARRMRMRCSMPLPPGAPTTRATRPRPPRPRADGNERNRLLKSCRAARINLRRCRMRLWSHRTNPRIVPEVSLSKSRPTRRMSRGTSFRFGSALRRRGAPT